MSMFYFAFIATVTLCVPNVVFAGIDKFSYLDKIGDWTIERKINSLDQSVFCRASVNSNGTWFGSRIRLNESDELIFPKDMLGEDLLFDKRLDSVKIALKLCRESLIYFPMNVDK